MKNNINKEERVEVMALFGYEMTPCQPLSFRRRGALEKVEVTELLSARVKFIGATAMYLFDVLAGRERYTLSFNARELSWHLALAK